MKDLINYYYRTSRMMMMDCIICHRNGRHIEAEMFYEWAKTAARLMREISLREGKNVTR